MQMLPHLPLEIVLDIITSSFPSSQDALLNPAHPTTKLLLTFSLVCRRTRKVAARYLLQHCVYLDSERRLGSFLRSISFRPILRNVTSISLAPFCDDIDDLPLCSWIRELLCYTCETLKKLVIDIPLRGIYPEEDHLGVRRILREGFDRLVNLEEFVSTRDELFLDTFDHEHACVWFHWPKLKRLALWNVDANEELWRHIALHPSLEMVVLSNPDSLMDVDPKAEYFKSSDRPVQVIFSMVEFGRNEQPNYLQTAGWEQQDPEVRMRLYKHGPDTMDDYDLRPNQQCIKQAAEDGTLWDMMYKEVLHPAEIGDTKTLSH